eukprot:gene20210-26955_t
MAPAVQPPFSAPVLQEATMAVQCFGRMDEPLPKPQPFSAL